MADRSRDRWMSRTDRSLLLKVSTPMQDAKVEAKSSCVKIRDVFDVAVRAASSRIAFAAACSHD